MNVADAGDVTAGSAEVNNAWSCTRLGSDGFYWNADGTCCIGPFAFAARNGYGPNVCPPWYVHWHRAATEDDLREWDGGDDDGAEAAPYVDLQTGTLNGTSNAFLVVRVNAKDAALRKQFVDLTHHVFGFSSCCEYAGSGYVLLPYRAKDGAGNLNTIRIWAYGKDGDELTEGDMPCLEVLLHEDNCTILGTHPFGKPRECRQMDPFSSQRLEEPCKCPGERICGCPGNDPIEWSAGFPHADELPEIGPSEIKQLGTLACALLEGNDCAQIALRGGEAPGEDYRSDIFFRGEFFPHHVKRNGNLVHVRPPAEWWGLVEQETKPARTLDAGPPDDWYPPDPITEAQKQAKDVQAAKHAERVAALRTPNVWRDFSTIPPRQWLYGRHYIRKFLTSTVAPGGLGKSSLALVEAVAMASGKDLLGYQPRKPLRVLYLNGEDPLEELERRVAAILKFYGLTPEDLGGRLIYKSGRDAPIRIAVDEKTGTRVCAPDLAVLREVIREEAIDVLMLDPLVSFHEVPESDNTKINIICNRLATIADELNFGIEIVHHVRKSQAGQSEITAEDARGAKALTDKARSVRVLNGMPKEMAKKHGIADRHAYFHVSTGKGNLTPRIEQAGWHRIVNVPLGNDCEGLAGDEVGVVTVWRMPDIAGELAAEDIRAIQDKIAAGEWREDMRANAWAGNAIADVMDYDRSDESWRANAKAVFADLLKRKHLKISHRADAKRRLRSFVEVGIPPSEEVPEW